MNNNMDFFKDNSNNNLFKKALGSIENEENHGSPWNKADTKQLKNVKGSYIDSKIEEAKNMVKSGEAKEISQIEYRGGIEPAKNKNENEDEN